MTSAVPDDQPQVAAWANGGAVFTVVLGAFGTMTVGGRNIASEEELRTLAARAREQAPEIRALIQADALTLWKSVANTMSLLQQAGITKLAFAVTPGNGDDPRLSGATPRNTWDCPFPKAADAPGIDTATVVLTVAVDASGAPAWVQILNDPGYGFGMVAADCAMGKKYSPARDEKGQPVASKTPPIRVRFVR
ncbi:biopolymer transporter ExbD [Polyangium sp. 6x1]|uniref:biopolymer transporter ExbD n=1 Tax=Polyangium sp. 6x1 TaxID=3042689 RepID=UPI002482379F|nr:biopolymer transporter ExbD [Polyangium sp. 6x1]MDI1448286.1 energy transducer TonB [Polyangium sp. 6x1]